eukprot:2882474-Pyramimonas_sp.AAC.1
MQAFLEFISGPVGLRRLVLLGMMADGGLEVLQFLRWWDTEKHDISGIQGEINKLVTKLDWLFLQGNVVTFKEGCTHRMLKLLRSPRTVATGISNAPLSVGGDLAPECIGYCLKEMRSWMAVSIGVIKAEFPEFGLLNSFAAFSLACPPSNAASMIARLSQAFDVD